MSLGGSAEEFAANSSSVSFVITHAQKRMLREKGYSDAQIAEMAPAEAHNILGFMG